jgi:hypothetical protein
MTQLQQAEQAQATESHAQAQGEFALPPATTPSHVAQRALVQPHMLTSTDVLALQRSIGNRETARLLAPMRQPTPLQNTLQAEREVMPVAPPQISSGEPLIQRVWATVEGKDRKLNLRKIEGEIIGGEQVYEDSKTNKRYVRVAKLSKEGKLVVKRAPYKAQKGLVPGKVPVKKSIVKRHERSK